MAKITSVDAALLVFEDAASKHKHATEEGDYKIANKSYEAIVKAVNFLKEQNEVFRLQELLNHEYVGVRSWAATYLLPVREKEGIRVLEEIGSGVGLHASTAKITLSEWRKGNLTNL